MDTSTILFIITLIIAFIFMRWLVSPVPQGIVDSDVPSLQSSASRNRANGSNPRAQARSPREITDAMIEVVQSIAPQLSVGQIRMDLQRSGSVEATIERFMETGTLPVPVNERVPTPAARASPPSDAANTKSEANQTENLIEKFGLKEKVGVSAADDSVDEVGNKWGTSKQERNSLLTKRREEMILKARRRLEAQLKNEVDMPLR